MAWLAEWTPPGNILWYHLLVVICLGVNTIWTDRIAAGQRGSSLVAMLIVHLVAFISAVAVIVSIITIIWQDGWARAIGTFVICFFLSSLAIKLYRIMFGVGFLTTAASVLITIPASCLLALEIYRVYFLG